MSFFRFFGSSNSQGKKSPFGGKIQSSAQIKKLSQKIRAHEKRESESAKSELERDLRDL